MRRQLLHFTAALALTLAPMTLHAQNLGVGSRALGMGGGFTGLAEGVYAPLWNPAGVARIKRFQFAPFNLNARLAGPEGLGDLLSHIPSGTSEQIDLAKRLSTGDTRADVTANFAVATPGFALTILPFVSLGLSPRSSTGAVGLDFITLPNGTQIPAAGSSALASGTGGVLTMFSFGKNFTPKTSYGMNVRFLSKQTIGKKFTFNGATGGVENPVTTADVSGRNALNFALDFGVLHDVTPNLTLGASLLNLFHHDPVSGFGTQLSVGAAYRPNKAPVTLVADFAGMGSGHAYLNLGAEAHLGRLADFRFGIYKGRPALGVGLFRFIDVAYSPDNSMLSFNFNF